MKELGSAVIFKRIWHCFYFCSSQQNFLNFTGILFLLLQDSCPVLYEYRSFLVFLSKTTALVRTINSDSTPFFSQFCRHFTEPVRFCRWSGTLEASTWYDTLCLESIPLGSSNPSLGSPAFDLFSASLQSLRTKKLSRGTETVYKHNKKPMQCAMCVRRKTLAGLPWSCQQWSI